MLRGTVPQWKTHGGADSLEKLDAVLRLCAEEGVHTSPLALTDADGRRVFAVNARDEVCAIPNQKRTTKEMMANLPEVLEACVGVMMRSGWLITLTKLCSFVRWRIQRTWITASLYTQIAILSILCPHRSVHAVAMPKLRELHSCS